MRGVNRRQLFLASFLPVDIAKAAHKVLRCEYGGGHSVLHLLLTSSRRTSPGALEIVAWIVSRVRLLATWLEYGKLHRWNPSLRIYSEIGV